MTVSIKQWLAKAGFSDRQRTALKAILDAALADLTAARAMLGAILTGSATYDAASLADGAGATSTITVTGAAIGDYVIVSYGVDLQGILLTAAVTAADTVSFRLQNETTGAIDLASTTVRAIVFPRTSFAAMAALNLAA